MGVIDRTSFGINKKPIVPENVNLEVIHEKTNEYAITNRRIGHSVSRILSKKSLRKNFSSEHNQIPISLKDEEDIPKPQVPNPTPQVRQAPKPTPKPQVKQVPKPTPQIRQVPKPIPQVRQAPKPTPQVRQTPKPTPQVHVEELEPQEEFIDTSIDKIDTEPLKIDQENFKNLVPIKYSYHTSKGRRFKELGFDVKDVAKLYPELVKYDDNGTPVKVQYDCFIPLIVREVQTLRERLQYLEQEF